MKIKSRKQETPKCGTCKHLQEGIYYEPVCYKVTFLDGKWWATKRTLKAPACDKYVGRK